MSITKYIGTFIITSLLGLFAVAFTATPKKMNKNRVKASSSSIDLGREEREDLFI